MRGTLICIVGMLMLFEAYLLRHDATALYKRVAIVLHPERAEKIGPRSVSVRASWDDHYYVDATVNGTPINFLVDTGATTIALPRAEARRIGIDTEKLDYVVPMITANGVVKEAPVTLREVRVGPIVLRDIQAGISEGELDKPLLGMSFLGLLDGYTVKDRTLTMRGHGD